MPAAPKSTAADSTCPRPPPFRRIAVFCGSSAGTLPEYRQAAVDLGTEMAKRGIGLVYGGEGEKRGRGIGGERERKHWFHFLFFLSEKTLNLATSLSTSKHSTGGNIGLMGAVAESVQAGGQSVIGVIPEALQPREVRWFWRGEGGGVERESAREREKCRFGFFSFSLFSEQRSRPPPH